MVEGHDDDMNITVFILYRKFDSYLLSINEKGTKWKAYQIINLYRVYESLVTYQGPATLSYSSSEIKSACNKTLSD